MTMIDEIIDYLMTHGFILKQGHVKELLNLVELEEFYKNIYLE